MGSEAWSCSNPLHKTWKKPCLEWQRIKRKFFLEGVSLMCLKNHNSSKVCRRVRDEIQRREPSLSLPPSLPSLLSGIVRSRKKTSSGVPALQESSRTSLLSPWLMQGFCSRIDQTVIVSTSNSQLLSRVGRSKWCLASQEESAFGHLDVYAEEAALTPPRLARTTVRVHKSHTGAKYWSPPKVGEGLDGDRDHDV